MNSRKDVDPIESAIALGTTFFKNEQYQKAKDLFIKTLWLIKTYSKEDIIQIRTRHGLVNYNIPNVPIVHPQLIKILDNVAACYEKLGELEKALKISNKMIKKEPFNLICYIRRGKILQKMSKDKDAYQNYQKGLNECKKVSKEYNINISKRLLNIVKYQMGLVKQRIQSTYTLNQDNERTSSQRSFIDPIKEHHSLLKQQQQQKQEDDEREDQLSLSRKRIRHFISTDSRNTKYRSKTIDFIGTLPLELLPYIFNRLTVKDLIHLYQVSRCYKQIVMTNYSNWFQDFILNSVTNKLFIQFHNFIQKLYSRSIFRQNGTPWIRSLRLSSRLASDEPKLLQKLFAALQNYRCNELILSVPNCATSHIVKYIVPNDTFCQNTMRLSLTTSLRSDKPYEIRLLNHFNNLTNLELIFDSAVVPINHSSQNNNNNDENNNLESLNNNWSPNLQSYKLICDSKKIKTFPTRDLFTSINNSKYELMTKLCITGVTLCSNTEDFKWLRKFPSLNELWLENNHNGKLSNLLNLFKTEHIFKNGSLEVLVFRENQIFPKIDMEAIPIQSRYHYKHNLSNLKKLDVMGTSISGTGLHRLVASLSPEKLISLNIGDCPYIHMQQYQNDYNPNVFSPFDFFPEFDSLEELRLPQLGSLNDQSLHMLALQVMDLQKLKVLDLSLNMSITGVSVYEFVSKLYETKNKKPLERLIIDGCSSISHITVNSIKTLGYVKQIDCVYEREIWRQFGVNSFKYK